MSAGIPGTAASVGGDSSSGGVSPVIEVRSTPTSGVIREVADQAGADLHNTATREIVVPALEPPTGFFEHNTEPRREIIEGLIREGQIAAIGGPFGVGKSPLLQDLSICRTRGITWCGRRVEAGPVILFDFESAGPAYRRGISNICRRYGVTLPLVPEELDAYLLNDDGHFPATSKLLEAVAEERMGKIPSIWRSSSCVPISSKR
jgi:RecA-family ATPase